MLKDEIKKNDQFKKFIKIKIIATKRITIKYDRKKNLKYDKIVKNNLKII